MSKYGGYLSTAKGIMATLEGEKPHSSVSDWVEILSSDRYGEDSLDGIPELIESINLQGYVGTQEASRAIRKKLKYGNTHRQIRALTILRALSENGSKAFQHNFANQQLLERLKTMATDPLTDPKVKRKLILVFHAWSVQHKEDPKMNNISNLYGQFAGGARRPAASAPSASSGHTSSRAVAQEPDMFSHSWAVAPGQAGADTYSDLAAAKADADERKRSRDAKLALEQREADIARRERELQRKKDMAALEETRRREALEEAERRRKLKEQQKKGTPEPKRPKFDFQKEKPNVLVAVANAIQCANNLVNSCRHVNRAEETLLENVRVQENLDKAKAARRTVIRYIQVVTDEEFVGTLLEANEKIVEAIQLYDTLSRPSVDDSDSEHEDATPASPPNREAEALARRLEATKLRSDHTGELDRLRERQKKESAKSQQRRLQRGDSHRGSSGGGVHADLRDLDFGGGIRREEQGRLPPPMQPDEDDESFRGSLSDFSDYDSSDEEYRMRSQAASRRQSVVRSRRQSVQDPHKYPQQDYQALDDNVGRRGLLDPDDPFSDPFGDDETPAQEKPRMEWRAI